MRTLKIVALFVLCLAAVGTGIADAHITPPVTLMSERDAVVGMAAGAKKIFFREVKLTAAEKAEIKRRTGWNAGDPFYRFYIGRDGNGEIVSAVTFLTDFTIHGPIRVAVAIGQDGKIRDAKIVECTEETFVWVKPSVERNFARAYVGQDSRGSFAHANATTQENMVVFYNHVATSLVQRGAVLFDLTFLKRGEK
jgi:hypothetical protein